MQTIGYTINEAANLLGIHPRTVRRQIWNKEIFAERKGNVLIIPPLQLKKIKIRAAHRPQKSSTT